MAALVEEVVVVMVYVGEKYTAVLVVVPGKLLQLGVADGVGREGCCVRTPLALLVWRTGERGLDGGRASNVEGRVVVAAVGQ